MADRCRLVAEASEGLKVKKQGLESALSGGVFRAMTKSQNQDPKGRLRPPESACRMSFDQDLELVCLTCGVVQHFVLPLALDGIIQRGRDFANYHRWCSGPTITKSH
jgi:hypothetical protein